MPRRGLKIGLFGGSFNPAHAGHLHISRLALAHLGLHQLWWLVSPQNPLKERRGMKPLAERMNTARAIARDPRIRVSAIETRLHTTYTADTLRALRQRFPGTHFVWIMGADNLSSFHRWRDWTQIFNTVPIAIYDRPTYSLPALAARAAVRFRYARRGTDTLSALATATPPAWTFIHCRLHEASATALRRLERSVQANSMNETRRRVAPGGVIDKEHSHGVRDTGSPHGERSNF